jgi:hypothetical protein
MGGPFVQSGTLVSGKKRAFSICRLRCVIPMEYSEGICCLTLTSPGWVPRTHPGDRSTEQPRDNASQQRTPKRPQRPRASAEAKHHNAHRSDRATRATRAAAHQRASHTSPRDQTTTSCPRATGLPPPPNPPLRADRRESGGGAQEPTSTRSSHGSIRSWSARRRAGRCAE